MGFSKDYSHVPDWVEKPEGYKTGEMVKYEGNVFIANFWADKPGEGEADKNGWRLHDELYDVTSSPAAGPARIIGYIPTWRKQEGFDYANKEMYRNITNGIISFLMFSETELGEFEPKSVDDVDAIFTDVVLTGHECGTYISIALGGATDYGFLSLMERIGSNPADPVLQKAVKNVVDFVETYGLDGVDLDLECWWDKNSDPNKDQGGRLRSDGAHPAGKGLTEFAKQLKQAMPDKIISAALFATSWYGNCYDPGLVEYVDWLGIMTYDLTGSWNQTPVGPQTALWKIREQKTYAEEQQGEWPGNRKSSANAADPMSDNPILSVEDSLWYWTNPFFTNWQGKGQSLKRNKIAAGVPIYGYDFAYGKEPDDLSGQIAPGYKTIRYKDLLNQFPGADTAANGNIKVAGNTARPPFVSAPGTYPYAHNIYFETPKTATDKLNFLKSVGAQGVIIWELSNDIWEEGKSIIKALYQNSGNPATRPALPSKIKPKPDPTFPREWIGVFPDQWFENVEVSSFKSLQARGTEKKLKDFEIDISGSPAVAVFNNKLYCVYEGPKNDGLLHYCFYDGQKWSGDITLLDHKMSGSPALAVFQDKLYCVYEGYDGSKETGWLHYCTFDRQTWSGDTALHHGTSLREGRYPCASLAVYKGLLYCVHEGAGNGGKGWLYYFTFDGHTWSDDKPLGDHGTTGSGSLAVVDGKLICLHEAKDRSGEMWFTSFEDFLGTNKWNKDQEVVLLNNKSKDVRYNTSGAPGVVTYGNQLFCVYKESGNDGWLRSFNTEERVDKKLITGKSENIGTSFPPGLALYKNFFRLLYRGRGASGWLEMVSSSPNEVLPNVVEFNLRLPDRRPGPPYAGLDRYNLPLTEHQFYGNDAHPVEMARHHIIPDNRLRDFWNQMLESDHIYTAAGEFLAALDQNMDRYQITLRPADITQLRELLRGIQNGTIRHNPAAEPPDAIDNLAAIIRWLPGNIFIGPRSGGGRYQRTDDPGDGLESNAHLIVGGAFPHREAYAELENYMRAGDANNARRALTLLAGIAVRVEPYDVNPSVWVRMNDKYTLGRGDRDEL